jgi:ferredoxin/flavodoxin
MRIAVIFFSATGNTRQIADQIASRLKELGSEAKLIDITSPEKRQANSDLSKYDGMVLGAPIHSMRAPRLVRDWIATLQGDGMKCATYFTYGGFQVHPTHFDTRQRLEDRGFKVVASAEFLGKHTFNLGGWQAMLGRPDNEDASLARQYADALYARFSGQDDAVVQDLDKGPYTEDQLNQFEDFRFKLVTQLPTRNGEECQQCLLCEEECPAGAMDAETGQADPGKCIVCLRCMDNCPDEALAINDISPFFQHKMEMDGETPETLAAKKSKLYL